MALPGLLFLVAALAADDGSQAARAACCAQARPVSVVPPDSCPVTVAAEPSLVPRPPQPAAAPFGSAWYGSQRLWTVLPRGGVLGRDNKSFWWSEAWPWRTDHRPRLTVTARRVDGGPEARSTRATNAHAADIGHAMLVGLSFPAPGCWEVRGEYQGAALSFVAWVP